MPPDCSELCTSSSDLSCYSTRDEDIAVCISGVISSTLGLPVYADTDAADLTSSDYDSDAESLTMSMLMCSVKEV